MRTARNLLGAFTLVAILAACNGEMVGPEAGLDAVDPVFSTGFGSDTREPLPPEAEGEATTDEAVELDGDDEDGAADRSPYLGTSN